MFIINTIRVIIIIEDNDIFSRVIPYQKFLTALNLPARKRYTIRDNVNTHTRARAFCKNKNRGPLPFLNKEVPNAKYPKRKIQDFKTTNKVTI